MAVSGSDRWPRRARPKDSVCNRSAEKTGYSGADFSNPQPGQAQPWPCAAAGAWLDLSAQRKKSRSKRKDHHIETAAAEREGPKELKNQPFPNLRYCAGRSPPNCYHNFVSCQYRAQFDQRSRNSEIGVSDVDLMDRFLFCFSTDDGCRVSLLTTGNEPDFSQSLRSNVRFLRDILSSVEPT